MHNIGPQRHKCRKQTRSTCQDIQRDGSNTVHSIVQIIRCVFCLKHLLFTNMLAPYYS